VALSINQEMILLGYILIDLRYIKSPNDFLCFKFNLGMIQGIPLLKITIAQLANMNFIDDLFIRILEEKTS
jgi:hypothetical protein